MKATYYEKYGLPNVLSVKEIQKPIPKDNDILIKVISTTVNRTDCAFLSGKPFIMKFFTGLIKPKKNTLGTDLAGVVETVGKNIVNFNPGDRVFLFDDSGIQSQAEYAVISNEKVLTKLPDNIEVKEAAACIEGFHYAYNFLNKIKVKKGQKIMINGGTGSIGSAAIQICKYYGLDITATCRAEHFDLVKSLGADKIIDYEKEDFTKQNEHFDFIFDAVGKSRFNKCKPVLVDGGIYLSSELGPNCENIFLALFTSKFGNKKVKFPIPLNPKASLELSAKLISEGKFKPVIDRFYSLNEVSEAYKYVNTGQKVGNVLINMDNK